MKKACVDINGNGFYRMGRLCTNPCPFQNASRNWHGKQAKANEPKYEGLVYLKME